MTENTSRTMGRTMVDDAAAPDVAMTGTASRDPRGGVADGAELHTADLVRGDQSTPPTPSAGGPSSSDDGMGTPLLADADDYRHRWDAVQTGFVDEPRRAVERADALVAEVMAELASSFAQERNGLESQWSQGDQVSTEDLRVSLRRYRSFFDRLLAT